MKRIRLLHVDAPPRRKEELNDHTVNDDQDQCEQETVYLNNFFHFDPKANLTYDLVFGQKAVLTNEDFWHTVQEALFSTFGTGAAVMLYQMGLKYGYAVGTKARHFKKDVHEAVKFLETYGLMAGWGKFKTSDFELFMGKLNEDVTVEVRDNFFALPVKSGSRSDRKKSGKPKCFIIAGLLAGVTEGLLGEGHNCIETSCVATGADRCVFVISKRV